MAIDLSNKRVIMVHGLASKPPKENLHSLWEKCIIENIRIKDRPLAEQLTKHNNVFESAYWANAVPRHIGDDSEYVKKLSIEVEEVIKERKKIKDKFHVTGKWEEVEAFFKNRGQDVLKLLAGALTVKDDVMKAFIREVELYDEDQYIADRMRRPLEDSLRKAWKDNCEVALITHSMGTFIAYDVLWRFSHRNVPDFKKFRKKRIHLFTTMGSPLGDPTIQNLLFARYHKNHGKRQFPTNIIFWHNYACLSDVVSHYHNFEDVFFKPMREVKIFPGKPKFRTRDYANLHNPFKVVKHSGNRGKIRRNPHKSYGYLVQPHLGTWLTDFFKGQLKH